MKRKLGVRPGLTVCLNRLIWHRSTALRRINLWQIFLVGEGSGWAERWDGLGLTELLGTTRTGDLDSQVRMGGASKILLCFSEKMRRGHGMTEGVTYATWDMFVRKVAQLAGLSLREDVTNL